MGKKPVRKSRPKRAAKPAGDAAPAIDAGEDGSASEGGAAAGRPAAGGARGRGGRARRQATTAYRPGAAKDRHLVIVESPSKAKTINKYLGRDYLVLASVGHVRDLPSRNPKGVKAPVPGVDLEHDFRPHYEVSEGKERVIADLKRAAKETLSSGRDVWFATDLDREGEAIAWHLAQELGIASSDAKRVVFAAITKAEIERAFSRPHPIDEDRVNAQQARRILDRIVGYQVSPLLWKKVARGLSAGRVQSVAVRLVVEREREIRVFVPDEIWGIEGVFTPDLAAAPGLREAWRAFASERDAKGAEPTQKARAAWMGEHASFRAELIEVAGEKFDCSIRADDLLGPATDLTPEGIRTRHERAAAAFNTAEAHDVTPRVAEAARLAGLTDITRRVREDASGRGPARYRREVVGVVDAKATYRVTSIETRRTTSRPPAPFITSTLQQAASSRLGFGAQRTMRTAQQLYEGVDVPGEGPVGLITYMRTDSTHISAEAIESVRGYISRQFGGRYLPETPNFYKSSNKGAQEAHEAIRPTSLDLSPSRVRGALTPDQLRLYTLVWERFVASQMTSAQWDATSVLIVGGVDPARPCTFRAGGRALVFDGYYRVAGVPQSADEQTMPALREGAALSPVALEPEQRFSAPPARYSEASLVKTLEAEGIGRPSTYASIIQTIQDRKYVEKESGRFFASDLGEVVTDKLIEAIPSIMDVGYTREMEKDLDLVEDEHLDWIQMLHRFYAPFQDQLRDAEKTLVHAKAETVPAPDEYKCPQCGSGLVYRFGKNGRFLSCSTYPACNYASPVDRDGKPRPAAETVDVACPICGSAMTKRVGRFGAFLGCSRYADKANPCDGILNLDKKGRVVAKSPPAYQTDLACPTCKAPLSLRGGVRGPWLGCSRFPKCRGRGKWAELPEATRAGLEKALAAHERSHPVPIIRTMSGAALTDASGKALATARPVGQQDDGPETLESVADELGV
ncbi:MAG: DNA topoisomerase [Planctomycetota bacterium]|nr:DNA topoisomerase [Planctomycetota bacterium]